jgi:hypothetical protein
VSSVPKQPTILDRISCWDSVTCREPGCGLLVDAIWLREDHVSPNDVHFCPDDALARVPPLERAATRTALQRVRALHARLGLGHPVTLRALRVDVLPWALPPTLFGYCWPERVNGCDIDLFAVRGFSRTHADDLKNVRDLAALPMYHPEPMAPDIFAPTPEEERSRRPFLDHCAAQEPIWQSTVLVELAFTASLSTKPLEPRIVSWTLSPRLIVTRGSCAATVTSHQKRPDAELRRHQPHQTPGEGFLERLAVEGLLLWGVQRHHLAGRSNAPCNRPRSCGTLFRIEAALAIDRRSRVRQAQPGRINGTSIAPDCQQNC